MGGGGRHGYKVPDPYINTGIYYYILLCIYLIRHFDRIQKIQGGIVDDYGRF